MIHFTRSFNESLLSSPLEEVVHHYAEKFLKIAIMTEFEGFLERYRHLRDREGKQLIVRNGYHKERRVMTPFGLMGVKVPRVLDRRQVGGKKLNFSSRLVPPYLRRSSRLDEFIPFLYLKGISSGDFSEVLSQLFGESVSLSAQTVGRLKKKWESEFSQWSHRDLSGKEYVYWWVDGIHMSIRMEPSRNCILVVIGVLPNGEKELVAVCEGPVESELSWRGLLGGLKSQGLRAGPLLAIGDGALGFWNALIKEFPDTRQQRCWVHKTENVLDKLPRSVRPEAKEKIREIYMSPGKAEALKAFDRFEKLFGAKYPRAVECLLKNKEELLTFYDFPAEHWRHIRSTNAIESIFATVRLRTYKTRGCLCRKTALAMVFKLVQSAQNRWQRIHSHKLLPLILAGEQFIDGLLQAA
jgi:putative transposase